MRGQPGIPASRSVSGGRIRIAQAAYTPGSSWRGCKCPRSERGRAAIRGSLLARRPRRAARLEGGAGGGVRRTDRGAAPARLLTTQPQRRDASVAVTFGQPAAHGEGPCVAGGGARESPSVRDSAPTARTRQGRTVVQAAGSLARAPRRPPSRRAGSSSRRDAKRELPLQSPGLLRRDIEAPRGPPAGDITAWGWRRELGGRYVLMHHRPRGASGPAPSDIEAGFGRAIVCRPDVVSLSSLTATMAASSPLGALLVAGRWIGLLPLALTSRIRGAASTVGGWADVAFRAVSSTAAGERPRPRERRRGRRQPWRAGSRSPSPMRIASMSSSCSAVQHVVADRPRPERDEARRSAEASRAEPPQGLPGADSRRRPVDDEGALTRCGASASADVLVRRVRPGGRPARERSPGWLSRGGFLGSSVMSSRSRSRRISRVESPWRRWRGSPRR
jgi:hypothetical protein